MSIDLSQVNWLAVVVSGFVSFLLGGAWYSALFGKVWIRMQGWSDEKVEELKRKMSPPKFFGGMIVSYLVLAAAVAMLVAALGLKGPAAGAYLGSILWLGPAAAIGFTGHLASDRKLGAYLIDSSFQLLCLVTQGVIIASWK